MRECVVIPGDLNGDNVINLNDYKIFVEAFGSSAGGANWSSNADLNCDGVVNLLDFNLLAEYFGLSGDPAP